MKRIFGLITGFTMLLILTGCGADTNTSQEASSPAIVQLASCLTDNGAVFYGTERCPHCKTQKKLFGDAMSEVNYIDCDKSGPLCQGAGVQGYPTWVFADGTQLVGTQSLDALATKAGCTFAPEALIPQD